LKADSMSMSVMCTLSEPLSQVEIIALNTGLAWSVTTHWSQAIGHTSDG
jgi:hypothetical protein